MPAASTCSPDTEIDPLATHGMRFAPRLADQGDQVGVQAGATPFGLRWIQPVAHRAEPAYQYCPDQQVAIGVSGSPLAPQLKKDWTTTDYSTDGEDPPSSEEFGWEEV